MYAEKHPFQNRFTQGLQWICRLLILGHLTAFLCAEIGLIKLPWGYLAHLGLLLFAVGVLVVIRMAGLNLRVNNQGWAVRLYPLQLFFRQINWTEIKQLRWLKPEELPIQPSRNFSYTRLISQAKYAVLCLELTNGYQIFISIQQPAALMAFLEHELIQAEWKRKVV